LLTALAFFSVGSACAQVATKPIPVELASSPGPVDEIVTLSPFTVTASTDTGYRAASTLAGTRLDAPVKDLGSSIYTKDFLQDIGATNYGEWLIFPTGMEAASAGGNFSGATNDINSSQMFANGPRVDPQQSSRTRGLAAPNPTRGLFPSSIALDGYNTERVTVNRRPTAILFCVGSPAGAVFGIKSWLKAPELERILDAVKSPALKDYYGVGNMWEVGEFASGAIRRLGCERICEIHLKELDDLYGKGSINFEGVRLALDDIGYRGWLGIEGVKMPLGVEPCIHYDHDYLRPIFPKSV
jgi:hypothetical protein